MFERVAWARSAEKRLKNPPRLPVSALILRHHHLPSLKTRII
jgi:hypothetical protein